MKPKLRPYGGREASGDRTGFRRPQWQPLPTRGRCRRRGSSAALEHRPALYGLAAPPAARWVCCTLIARRCPDTEQLQRRGAAGSPCEPPASAPRETAAISFFNPRRVTAGGSHIERGRRHRAGACGRHFEYWHRWRTAAPPGPCPVSAASQPPGAALPPPQRHVSLRAGAAAIPSQGTGPWSRVRALEAVRAARRGLQ